MKSKKEDIERDILREYKETGDVIISRKEAILITIAFFKEVGIEKTVKECVEIVDKALSDIQEEKHG